MSAIECVVAARSRLGESPVWSIDQQRLFWVDGRAPAIFGLDPLSGKLDTWPAPGVVGSIGLRRGGGLVVAMKREFYRFDFGTGAFALIAGVEADRPDNRFNDGRCDRRGRFWSGTMNDARRDPDGSLYRLDPDGRVTQIRGDMVVPNSLCWSLDDRTMFLADTYRHKIYAYDYDIATGEVSNQRIFSDCDGHPGRPDGSTVDSDGFLWNCEYAGGRIVRYAPDGRIDRVIEMPVSQPTSLSFGGADLGTLYITSATQRLSDADLAAQPLAGSLFAIDVGVRGVPEPQFWG